MSGAGIAALGRIKKPGMGQRQKGQMRPLVRSPGGHFTDEDVVDMETVTHQPRDIFGIFFAG